VNTVEGKQYEGCISRNVDGVRTERLLRASEWICNRALIAVKELDKSSRLLIDVLASYRIMCALFDVIQLMSMQKARDIKPLE
jgi:hypothetical protein